MPYLNGLLGADEILEFVKKSAVRLIIRCALYMNPCYD